MNIAISSLMTYEVSVKQKVLWTHKISLLVNFLLLTVVRLCLSVSCVSPPLMPIFG